MGQTLSQIKIINLAMIELGQSLITDLSEGTKAASLASEVWNHARDTVLEARAWTFATKRVSLGAAITDEPLFGYTYAYSLPSDCLRFLKIADESEERTDVNFEINDNRVLTDLEGAYCKYVRRVTDTTKFSPKFAGCLSLQIAALLAKALTGSTKTKALMIEAYDDAMATAGGLDASQDNKDDSKSDSWISSR